MDARRSARLVAFKCRSSLRCVCVEAWRVRVSRVAQRSERCALLRRNIACYKPASTDSGSMLGAIFLRIDMKPSTPMTLIAVQISSTNGAIPRGAKA